MSWLVGVLSLTAALGLSVVASSSAAPGTATTLSRTCISISAVLSNGPDPGADPVGYAQAQILPLHRFHTDNHQLKRAIDQLASAYATYVRHDGDKAAKAVVKTAARKVNAICPGAAQ
ncbi:MAG TPA: hypothetical protein VGG41_17020 [Solirubrobacteraceae bacterium]